MRNAVVIDPQDNVAVAIEPLAAGTRAQFAVPGAPERSVVVTDDVPLFHKFAIQPIPAGSAVVKYGEYIGVATCDIEPGAWAHIHNVESTDAQKDLVEAEDLASGTDAAGIAELNEASVAAAPVSAQGDPLQAACAMAAEEAQVESTIAAAAEADRESTIAAAEEADRESTIAAAAQAAREE